MTLKTLCLLSASFYCKTLWRRLKALQGLIYLAAVFVCMVSIETITLCSYVMSIMSVMSLRKKSDNFEGQTQSTVWFSSQTGEFINTLWLLLVILSIYFFLVKRNFAKKGVMVVIGAQGVDSTYERGEDARRKFWIKPLKETDLGVAHAFFDP